MSLDHRSKSILEVLVENPSIPSRELEVKENLTRRQIKYSIEKINKWLEENNYPLITRLKNGHFLVDPILTEVFMNKDVILNKHYNLSETERTLLIIFILLSKDDLSIYHFTQALKVSNVTILNNIKKAQEKINAYELEIVYSRTEGYKIVGKEWSKRNLLYHVVQELRDRYGGLTLLKKYTPMEEDDIATIVQKLEEVEQFLDIKFTDEKMQLLPYLIGIILDRVDRGNAIENDYNIAYTELSDTKEYKATEILLKSKRAFPEVERLYVTLQILSTNIFSEKTLTETEIPQLREVLYDVLRHFEINAFIELKDKEYLVNRLMLHLKPAYYRIKYNLTSYHKPSLQLDSVFIQLDHLVENSLTPLETFLNNKISDNERIYITVFIGGHLIETNQTLPARKRAVVVCRNGVTISKMLRNTLTKLFPEFDFYPTMSLREFTSKSPPRTEIVFSPEPIETNAKVFIIHSLLSVVEQRNLRKRVFNSIFGVSVDTIDLDELMNIIEKSAHITDKTTLREALQTFFVASNGAEDIVEPTVDVELGDLITAENISLINSVDNWQEAIQLASKPLLENKSITPEYVSQMIRVHDYEQPYMILGNKIAIPHAEPRYGVNKLGMSMLIVKEGVLFSEKQKVHFVVVIAPTDTEEHVTAIYQLGNLAMDHTALNNILITTDKLEISSLLKKIAINK